MLQLQSTSLSNAVVSKTRLKASKFYECLMSAVNTFKKIKARIVVTQLLILKMEMRFHLFGYCFISLGASRKGCFPVTEIKRHQKVDIFIS